MMLLAAVLNIPDLGMVGQQLLGRYFTQVPTNEKKQLSWCSPASNVGEK